MVTVQCQFCLSQPSVPSSYHGSYEGPWRCPTCGARHVIRTIMSGVVSVRAVDKLGMPEGDFPEGVSTSLTEMVRAFNADAPRAAAVMLRRALECACVDKGATGRDLRTKIAALGGKLLDEYELAQANGIRLLGNYGAHPDNDGLDELTEKDAKRAIDFGTHLLCRLYPQRGG